MGGYGVGRVVEPIDKIEQERNDDDNDDKSEAGNHALALLYLYAANELAHVIDGINGRFQCSYTSLNLMIWMGSFSLNSSAILTWNSSSASISSSCIVNRNGLDGFVGLERAHGIVHFRGYLDDDVGEFPHVCRYLANLVDFNLPRNTVENVERPVHVDCEGVNIFSVNRR